MKKYSHLYKKQKKISEKIFRKNNKVEITIILKWLKINKFQAL